MPEEVGFFFSVSLQGSSLKGVEKGTRVQGLGFRVTIKRLVLLAPE